MKPLYAISQNRRALFEELESETLSEETLTALVAQLQINNAEYDSAISDVCSAIKEWSLEAIMCRAEAKRLTERARATETRLERLKGTLTTALAGQAWAHGSHKVKFRKCERCEPEADLPNVAWEEYLLPEYIQEKITYEPRKNEIKAAIKAGETVPGWIVREVKNITIE
jgi:chromosome segregation ATPase